MTNVSADTRLAPGTENLAGRPLDIPVRTMLKRRAAAVARRRPDWTLIASPAVTLAVMLWGVSASPYWGDEADTVSAVSRSLPQLIRLLGHIDAVHGFYYLLLWPVARIAGTGEFAMRLPSAVAMAAAAAGVTAIARRLASRRAGLCAGLLFAALPTVSIQAHDARPYAMITAAAVLASYLLVRTAQDPRPPLFIAYALSLVLVGYVQMFGLLLIPAHAVTLIGMRRRPTAGSGQRGDVPSTRLGRGWLVAVAVAGVAVAPVAILGWAQRAQIAWIPRPGWNDARDLVNTLIANSAAAAVVIGLLGALGAVRCGALARPRAWVRPRASARPQATGRRAGTSGRPRDRVDGPDRSLAWLAWPWLVLPPVMLLAASAITPVYFSRYVTYCLPAVALLAGAGLAALRWPVRVVILALVVALVVPEQFAMRVPGGGVRAVAEFLSAHQRPGDAIIYPEPSIPPWYLAYPDGLGQLRDISLDQTPGARGTLNAGVVPWPLLERRERSVRRIWVVPVLGGRDPAAYLAPGFRLAHEWKLDGYQIVLLYTKSG
jgi:mannosyltransferase